MSLFEVFLFCYNNDMKTEYSQAELDGLLAKVTPRHGWDFSSMHTQRQDVPWNYIDEVKKRLKPTDEVLDVGTGGGERFMQLAHYFKSGVGTDIDPEMVAIASKNAKGMHNLSFLVTDEKLADVERKFDLITNRHAPFDMAAIKDHLRPDGSFITQQVGEKNMQNVKVALGQTINKPTITRAEVEESGLVCVEFRKYDVEYVVNDIESLLFWLNALDMLHADLVGKGALRSAEVLNRILNGNVDERGFVTNEQRYLVIATRVRS